MKAVTKIIENLGYDPEPMIRAVGLTPKVLDDPDFIVPSALFGKLLAHCAVLTNCPHFGLLIGAEGNLAWLGRVGFLARNSSNVGEALQTLGEYFHHHDRSAQLGLRVENGQAILSYHLLFAMDASEQWLSSVLNFGAQIMRELCLPDWRVAEARFTFAEPADTRRYEHFFRAKLAFDAPETALVFDEALLARPIKHAEPELRRILLKEIENTNQYDPTDFPLDVTRTIRTYIGTGQCSAEKISFLIGISARALSGKLEEYGTSFKQIVESVRFEMAKQMIEHTDMPLREISERLDYSEISAFTRAFSRWSGTAPASWRRRARI